KQSSPRGWRPRRAACAGFRRTTPIQPRSPMTSCASGSSMRRRSSREWRPDMTSARKRPRKSAEEKASEAARHAVARARALEAIAWLGALGPGPIDVEALAEKLGAEIVFEDLEGAKARVIQIGARARIVISARIVGVGAIRFSIAHEIAHLLLKHYLK